MLGTLRSMNSLVDKLDELKTNLHRQVHDPVNSAYHRMRESMYQLLDITDGDIDILLNMVRIYAGSYNEHYQLTISITKTYLEDAKDSVVATVNLLLLHYSRPFPKEITHAQLEQIRDIMKDSKQKVALLATYLEYDYIRQGPMHILSGQAAWFRLFHKISDEIFCLESEPQNMLNFHESYLLLLDTFLNADPFVIFDCDNNTCNDTIIDYFPGEYFMNLADRAELLYISYQLSVYIDRIKSLSTCLNEFESFLNDAQTMLSADSKPKRWDYSHINMTILENYHLILRRLYDGYANGEYNKSYVHSLFSTELAVILVNDMDLLRSEIKDVLTDPLLLSASAITQYMTERYSTAVLATWLLSTYIVNDKDKSDTLNQIFDMNIWRQPLVSDRNRLTYEQRQGFFTIPEDVEYFVKNDLATSLDSILNRYVLKMKEAITSNDVQLRQMTYDIERDIKQIERELTSIAADTDFTQYAR